MPAEYFVDIFSKDFLPIVLEKLYHTADLNVKKKKRKIYEEIDKLNISK